MSLASRNARAAALLLLVPASLLASSPHFPEERASPCRIALDSLHEAMRSQLVRFPPSRVRLRRSTAGALRPDDESLAWQWWQAVLGRLGVERAEAEAKFVQLYASEGELKRAFGEVARNAEDTLELVPLRDDWSAPEGYDQDLYRAWTRREVVRALSIRPLRHLLRAKAAELFHGLEGGEEPLHNDVSAKIVVVQAPGGLLSVQAWPRERAGTERDFEHWEIANHFYARKGSVVVGAGDLSIQVKRWRNGRLAVAAINNLRDRSITLEDREEVTLFGAEFARLVLLELASTLPAHPAIPVYRYDLGEQVGRNIPYRELKRKIGLR